MRSELRLGGVFLTGQNVFPAASKGAYEAPITYIGYLTCTETHEDIVPPRRGGQPARLAVTLRRPSESTLTPLGGIACDGRATSYSLTSALRLECGRAEGQARETRRMTP